jgi:putative membrane protein
MTMSTINFTKDELTQINSAVKEAESKTSGEIATAFIKESYNYAIHELTFSVIIGFVYFLAAMFYTGAVEHWLEQMFWDYSSLYLVMFYGLTTFGVITLVYFLTNIPVIDRLIIPRSVMAEKVNLRAIQHFMQSGVYKTKDRTGILIFISNLERRVELLADEGISKKIPEEKWSQIVSHIIDGIHQNKTAQHLVEAIRQCGDILAEHNPVQSDDVNELNDNITILEK